MDLIELKKKYSYHTATTSMKQYLDIKFAHFNCLLLFRMGDFYELFYEDAIIASKILGIALTKRNKNAEEEIPMCGVPHHALENYLNRLIEDGFRVAICDQLETPEEAKKRGGYKAIVNRQVVRIITPGTIVEESLITANVPNYLASVVINKNIVAICYIDLGLAEINITQLPLEELINQLGQLKPKEILLSENLRGSEIATSIIKRLNGRITYQVDSFFAVNRSEKIILEFYNIQSIKAIGEVSSTQIASIGSILEYITLTQKQLAPSLAFPNIVFYYNYMNIDFSTRNSLEITQDLNGKTKGSLLGAIDYTLTKAGGRLLFKFLSQPLTDINEINHRLSVTEFFYDNEFLIKNIRKVLPEINDLERLVNKINIKRANAKDLLNIKDTLISALQVKNIFVEKFGINIPSHIESLVRILSGDEELVNLIQDSIRLDAPNNLNEGGYIKYEYHDKVRELSDLINNGKNLTDHLKNIYQKETTIDSLKIQHNNVLGLFIEISARYASKITDPKFIHRQTTANTVRYTTIELQKLESEIVNAKSLIINLELEIFISICNEILKKKELLKELAAALSYIDVFSNLAFCAHEHNYCKPKITEDRSFEIIKGRHPVIEQALAINKRNFNSNDCNLHDEERIWLITGPNMSGKSTFLRQNALITILAQIGSYVPATAACIGIVDKIFSRIGAGDDLMKGESTFMVEMLETSAILAQGTERSLIILDEVGRGTSTYDGVAIAWSVLEYIHDKIKCRCLFATHYFELTNLTKYLLYLKNYTVAIEEIDGTILFLHSIIKGVADKSYGIHVAQLAGLPNSVIQRASNILSKLEKANSGRPQNLLKNISNNLSLFES